MCTEQERVKFEIVDSGDREVGIIGGMIAIVYLDKEIVDSWDFGIEDVKHDLKEKFESFCEGNCHVYTEDDYRAMNKANEKDEEVQTLNEIKLDKILKWIETEEKE